MVQAGSYLGPRGDQYPLLESVGDAELHGDVQTMTKPIMISEIFGPVIHGEGPVAGRQTMFVRTFGCDSRCSVCDTMYSVDPNHPGAKSRHKMTPDAIAQRLDELDPEYVAPHLGLRRPVTISGGNPAMWDLEELVTLLQTKGRWVWIETQGTTWKKWLSKCDRVVVSPKGPGMDDRRLGILPLEKLEEFYQGTLSNVHCKLAFKVVIFGEADLDYAESIVDKYPRIPMYLSVGNTKVDKEQSADDVVRLTECLRMTTDSALIRPKLRNSVVLPQLHVLAYGNQRGT